MNVSVCVCATVKMEVNLTVCKCTIMKNTRYSEEDFNHLFGQTTTRTFTHSIYIYC